MFRSTLEILQAHGILVAYIRPSSDAVWPLRTQRSANGRIADK